jgi:hypothetical protein
MTKRAAVVVVVALLVGAALGAGGVLAARHHSSGERIEVRAEQALQANDPWGMWRNAKVRDCNPWTGSSGQWDCVVDNGSFQFLDEPPADVQVRFLETASGELVANVQDIECWSNAGYGHTVPSCGP